MGLADTLAKISMHSGTAYAVVLGRRGVADSLFDGFDLRNLVLPLAIQKH